MYNVLRSINNGIVKAVNYLMIALMSLMTLFIFMQVVYRYVLRQPLSWSEELARYLFSAVTLFGAVLLYRDNKHINMTLLRDMIKNKIAKTVVDIAAALLVLVFLLVVIRYGFPMTAMMLELKSFSPSMTWLKMGYVYMLLPVSTVLSVLAVSEVILSTLIKLNKKENT